MLVIVTDAVRNRIIGSKLTEDECEKLAAVLNMRLKNKAADEITYDVISQIETEVCGKLGIEPKTMINVLNFIYESVSVMNDSEIYVANAKSILKYPEYRDVDKAREIFSFLEDKRNLKKLFAETDDEGIKAKIGKENEYEILKDSSIVTANYSLDGKAVGKVGVIGPKRMDYAKVFASLDLISHEINKLVGYISGDS